jgi:hypothetical protein
MSCQYSALIFQEPKNCVIEDMPADVRINGTQGIVHKYNICIKVDGPRNIETLLLPARDVDASLADLSRIAMWQHI